MQNFPYIWKIYLYQVFKISSGKNSIAINKTKTQQISVLILHDLYIFIVHLECWYSLYIWLGMYMILKLHYFLQRNMSIRRYSFLHFQNRSLRIFRTDDLFLICICFKMWIICILMTFYLYNKIAQNLCWNVSL